MRSEDQPCLSRATQRLPCEGLVPLRARLEPWQEGLARNDALHAWIDQFGSPLNFHCLQPFHRNAAALRGVAEARGVEFEIFFARKANKCRTFVSAALEAGFGVDVASWEELSQCLTHGAMGSRIICTAAVKSEKLLRACLVCGATVAVDNLDELVLLGHLATESDQQARVALRVSGFRHEGEPLYSRFGFDLAETLSMTQSVWKSPRASQLRIVGLHFHLDGYSAPQRISAIKDSLDLVDALRRLGHDPMFLDMGGGIPMRYLESEDQWEGFWGEHRSALLGKRAEVTYRNHALGLFFDGNRVLGSPRVYPFYQRLVQESWLASVLDASHGGGSLAKAIRERNLQLRCEPGRSLLDGSGATVGRVEFRKRTAKGDWLIGLSMNRTQCRTSSEDFLVDPLLIRRPESGEPEAGEEMQGYLVGAYCTESELICLRKLRFPSGVSRGDLLLFPNTAGYFMHFLESRSHQFPLAKNVFVDAAGEGPPVVDALDR